MASDPYVYPGTDTLKNHMGIRDSSHLSVVEAELSHLALVRITANGILGDYDLAHLQEFHRQIFAKIYPWAGRIRTVDIGKTGMFAHAPHIAPYLNDRFRGVAPGKASTRIEQERLRRTSRPLPRRGQCSASLSGG